MSEISVTIRENPIDVTIEDVSVSGTINQQDINSTIDEAKLLQDLVAKMFAPLVTGQVGEMLNGDLDEPDEVDSK